MAKYSDPLYGSTTYGNSPLLLFSVAPIVATAVGYQKVLVSWTDPSGSFTRIRLVRNENAYPETADDGITLWEESTTQGNVSRTSFIDNGAPVALVGGRYVYYRMFLRVNGAWRIAGSTDVLLPSDHYSHLRLDNPSDPQYPYADVPVDSGTTRKMIGMLPDVMFTGSAAGGVDDAYDNTPLSNYLAGMALTVDEFLNLADLLTPKFGERLTPPQLLPAKFKTLGLLKEPALPFKNQKRMLREAMYYYTRRGTALGLKTWLEAMTGYDTTVTISPNLMLDVQDSSFKSGIGRWTTNAALTADNTQAVPSESLAIEKAWVGKVVTSNTSGTISIGMDSPALKGVPVTAGTTYAFTFYAKKSTGSANVTSTVTWYTESGQALSTTASSATSAGTSWTKITATAAAPTNAAYAGINIAFSAAGTYYVDMCSFAAGDGTAAYEDARVVKVFFAPTRVNYMTNPSFETNTTGWTATGGTLSRDAVIPTDVYAGSYSGKVVASGAWSLAGNTATGVGIGRTYTGSAYVAASAASNATIKVDALRNGSVVATASSTASLGGQVATVTYKYRLNNVVTLATSAPHGFVPGNTVVVAGVDASLDGTYTVTQVTSPAAFSYALTGSDIALTSVSGGTATLSARTGWKRVAVPLLVPDDGLGAVDIRMTVSGTAGTYWVDATQLEDSSVVTEYFDGAQPQDVGVTWRGGSANANNAYSDHYPNRSIKIARAAGTIADGIVRNQLWSISTYAGIEATA